MMAVNSYPELFATLLGWQQYQNLWGIIVHTGLAFVPFIVMIIKNTTEPFLSQEPKSAYTISLRRVEFSLAAMILTIMFACQPMITVNPDVIHYHPVCHPDVKATPGNSGTTYDEAFPNLQAVKVPLWWYAITGISHGITAAANHLTGCIPNMREEEIQLDMTKIQDAPLRAEVGEFVQACYIPAWRKYNQKKPDITQYTKKYGSGDPDWIGSHAFQGLPGYYDTFQSSKPISGFPHVKSKDWLEHGQWGAPLCNAWWIKTKVGLYDRLKGQIKPDLWNSFVSKFKDETAADDAIKKLLSGSLLGAGYRENSGIVEKLGGGLSTSTLSTVGLAMHSMSYFPKMYTIIEALPLIQAYLLMACFVFLAIALPLSRYSFGTVLSLSFVIFSIIFWSYLWNLAVFVDTGMMKALNPNGGMHIINKDYGGTEALTSMVAVLMYIIIPLFFTWFMGWAGIKAGAGASGAIDRAMVVTGGAGGVGAVLRNIASRVGK